ncbi:chitinase-like protein 4 [Patella vulgata]|uniref:chitinase-like protein 4 n=1 Tax=Patella vulgata TaxID=6465 RepID=UPI00217F9D20|nr:chitinase-like protein 4 [Patella vulgata]
MNNMTRLKMQLVFFCTLVAVTVGQKKMFCYYNAEAQYRPGIGRFVPSDIDPTLCTHIVYSFANVSGLELTDVNSNDRTPGGLYEQTIALKQKNPDLKILLAVGGWEIGSEPFKELASTWQNRNTFSKNVVKYLRQYGFDGLDMDWEFPGTRGSPPEDKYKFTDLMRQLQNQFTQEAAATGNDKLLLTLATASGTYYINQSYQPKELISTLDYMLLMTYNYHGGWENTTGHHTGLWPNSIDKPGERRELNIDWSVDYWLDKGMPKDRLIMGLSSYGMSYTLNFTNQNGVGAPAKGNGKVGTYTNEQGILAYYEICENLKYKGWNQRYIAEQDSPYAFGGDQWVGYDNQDSLAIKAQYAKQKDLGGAMLWSVETDDFKGTCGEGLYPLLKRVNGIIRDGQTGSSGTQGSGDRGNQGSGGRGTGGSGGNVGGSNGGGNFGGGSSGVADGNFGGGNNGIGGGNVGGGNNGNNWGNDGGGNYGNNGGRFGGGGGSSSCASLGTGAHANPSNCASFFVCTETDDGYRRDELYCPAGLGFNDFIKTCDWSDYC